MAPTAYTIFVLEQSTYLLAIKLSRKKYTKIKPYVLWFGLNKTLKYLF